MRGTHSEYNYRKKNIIFLEGRKVLETNTQTRETLFFFLKNLNKVCVLKSGNDIPAPASEREEVDNEKSC